MHPLRVQVFKKSFQQGLDLENRKGCRFKSNYGILSYYSSSSNCGFTIFILFCFNKRGHVHERVKSQGQNTYIVLLLTSYTVRKPQNNLLCLRKYIYYNKYICVCVRVCVCLAPGPPASFRLESTSEKSMILYWSPPEETNGILKGYVVQYRKGKGILII